MRKRERNWVKKIKELEAFFGEPLAKNLAPKKVIANAAAFAKKSKWTPAMVRRKNKKGKK